MCSWPEEPYLLKIVERGRLFPGEGAELRFMAPSQCHRNAAKLWYDSESVIRIASGYALSEDGIWRQHSWGIDGERIVETTAERSLYFGFEHDFDESLAFTLSNPPTFLWKALGKSPGVTALAQLLMRVATWRNRNLCGSRTSTSVAGMADGEGDLTASETHNTATLRRKEMAMSKDVRSKHGRSVRLSRAKTHQHGATVESGGDRPPD